MASPPRHRRVRLTRRRLVIALIAALVFVPAAAYGVLALDTSKSPAPAKLPERPAPTGPSGPIDGVWAVSAEKHDFVGYRVREKLGPLPAPDDAVGRTRVVRGRLVISGGQISAARFSADLSTLKSDQPPRDGVLRGQGLQTDQFATGAFVLARPVTLGQPARGRILERTAVGRLTLRGVTRIVPVALQARWNGDSIDVVGHTSIRLADFKMTIAQRLGMHIADHGTMEFELTFRRPAAAKRPPEAKPVTEPGGPETGPPANPRQLAREPIAHRHGQLLVIAGPQDDLTGAYRVNADGSQSRSITPAAPKDRDLTSSVLGLSPESGGRTVLIARLLVPPQAEPEPPRIYRLSLSTRRLQPLTPLGTRAELPATSPRGDLIAYARGGAQSDQLRLYVARHDGSGARALPLIGISDEAPAWSPDGRRLAFACYAADDDICLIGADGHGGRHLTHGPSYDVQPAWSPNGGRIAFARDGDIWTMRANGSGLRHLTRGGRTRDSAPTWSPDGKTIAFIRSDGTPNSTFGGPGRVIFVHTNGGSLTRMRARLESVQLVTWLR